MTWYNLDDKPVDSIPEEYVAFVYKIINLIDGREYIGLKTTRSRKTKMVQKKKKRYWVESDWREYWSSSETLKQDVTTLGQDKFKRVIIFLCRSKAIANYIEAVTQFDLRVLENPDKYYNRIINCRINASHIKKHLDDIKQYY